MTRRKRPHPHKCQRCDTAERCKWTLTSIVNGIPQAEYLCHDCRTPFVIRNDPSQQLQLLAA